MIVLTRATGRIQEYFPDYQVVKGEVSANKARFLLVKDEKMVDFRCECDENSTVYKMEPIC